MWIKCTFSLDFAVQSMIFFNCILMIKFFLLVSCTVTSGVAQKCLLRARLDSQEVVGRLCGFGLFALFYNR